MAVTYHISQTQSGEWRAMHGNRVLGRYETEADADAHLAILDPNRGQASEPVIRRSEPKVDANHPRFPEFVTWMRAEKAGSRKCPAGKFPANFKFWLEGGRW